MILSAYERADSPYVRIQYADTRGKKRYVKTSIRKDDPEKNLKTAKALNRAEANLLDRRASTSPDTGASWGWVANYLRTRYTAKKRTQKIYLIQWDWLRPYLEESDIAGPAMLERATVFSYIDWRTNQVKEKSGRNPGLNTALGELKLLGLIMDEAIRRGLATANPARKLEIQREESREKPEISNGELAIIFNALRDQPAWMRRSFFIALETGLRFSDTQISRTQIDWPGRRVVIDRTKGGKKRAFAIEIYPSIEKLLREFWKSGDKLLWQMPAKEKGLNGLIWMRFFRANALPHLCFHCTRVTFITRGARAGVPESAMMKLVNHASKEVHRIYQRLAPPDARRLRAQIPIPSYADAI